MNNRSQQTDAAVEREFLHPGKHRPHYLERVSIVQALRELRHRVKPVSYTHLTLPTKA